MGIEIKFGAPYYNDTNTYFNMYSFSNFNTNISVFPPFNLSMPVTQTPFNIWGSGFSFNNNNWFNFSPFNFGFNFFANNRTSNTSAPSKTNNSKPAAATPTAANQSQENHNTRSLYNKMGLGSQGLNYKVFELAMEGYHNLTDKGNGYLGIFDTTQSDDSERYYLLDLNNYRLVGRTALKTGSGNMDNIKTANIKGSHATLSGFEKVGDEYFSQGMNKRALKIIGLEKGINDNSMAKGTVIHYTSGNNTWGCLGYTPIKKNGKIDYNATYSKMRTLFPKGTILFTNPTDPNYRSMSELYA